MSGILKGTGEWGPDHQRLLDTAALDDTAFGVIRSCRIKIAADRETRRQTPVTSRDRSLTGVFVLDQIQRQIQRNIRSRWKKTVQANG